ncbi:arylamine N-acetyltransferase family protein, partial [Mycolicibacterium setense]
MGLDLAAYFDRIGYQGPASADVETLRNVVAAHGRSIPFENLDPLLGVPVSDLSAQALGDKLITRRRGGYCYEHNGLLGYALDELGYGVERLAGRVVWMKEPDAPLPALTHNVLAVTVPDEAGRFL